MFKEKYFKYKKKYLELKGSGKGDDIFIPNPADDYFTKKINKYIFSSCNNIHEILSLFDIKITHIQKKNNDAKYDKIFYDMNNMKDSMKKAYYYYYGLYNEDKNPNGYGEIYFDNPDNRGQLNSKEKLLFKGNWIDGKKNNTGEYYYSIDNNGLVIEKYNGNWKDDKKNGKGIMEYYQPATANDDKYKISYNGDWMNNLMHGSGIFTYILLYKEKSNEKDDDIINLEYNGQWKNNKMNGKGHMLIKYRNDNDILIKGIWNDNNLNFTSAIVYNKHENDLTWHYLEGVYSGNGIFNGKLYNHSKICIYEGKWFAINNLWNDGNGMIYYPSGNIKYKGEWKDNKIDGKGILYYDILPIQIYYEGIIKDNKLNDGVKYDTNGNIIN